MPRLVYSDWLEDHGESDRAAFIRAQLEIAAMDERGEGEIDPNEGHTCFQDPCPVCTLVEKYQALQQREKALLNTHPCWWTWAEPIPKLLDAYTIQANARTGTPYPAFWEYRRGFVEKVACTAPAWLKHGEAIREQQPIRELRLTESLSVRASKDLQRLLALCHGLRHVRVDDDPGNDFTFQVALSEASEKINRAYGVPVVVIQPPRRDTGTLRHSVRPGR